MTKEDDIYKSPQENIEPFRFDEQVASVFSDMISRSVPGYDNLLTMIAALALNLLPQGARVYDLGCSLGAVSYALRSVWSDPEGQLFAVDNSPAMLKRCRQNLASQNSQTPYQCLEADICALEFENADLVVLNFTLQFVPVDQRDELLLRIASSLKPGGLLVLSEKVCFDSAWAQELLGDVHLNFKQLQGYSQLEIAQKRSALENVLIPETLAVHRARLERVGFKQIEPWLQCANFLSLLAAC